MKNVVLRIYSYSKDSQKDIKLGILFSFLNKIFDIAPELLIGVAVDLVVRKEDSLISQFGIKEPLFQLVFLGFITFIIWAFESLFQYFYSLKWKNVAQKLQHSFRLDTYQHIQKLDYEWLQKKSIGDIQTILNDDINQLERFINNGFNDIIQILSSTILIGLIFLYLSPLLALGTILPVPFILLGVVFFQKKIQPKYSAVRLQAGKLGAKISTNLAGISVIKSFTAELFQFENIKAESIKYCDANAEAIKISSAFIPLIRIIILIGFLITLVIGGSMAMNNSLAVGSYSALIFLTQRFLWPFTTLGELIDNFSRAKASAIRIFSILDTKISIERYKRESKNDIFHLPSISVKNISFGYPEKRLLFKDLSLSFPSNKLIALVGETGSGKSTLIKLILRFYGVNSGKIYIDNEDISQLPTKDLRKYIAYVSQEMIMFPGTIAQNIAFGDTFPSDEKIKHAARIAKADRFIEKLPQSYTTEIGEKGYKLSGGQKQRISIARAIYKDSPILIFDEATSSVDNKTEILIKKSLQEISKNKTTIIVAHRLSTIVNADLIYLFEDGKVLDSGSHLELLNKNKYYSNLWDLQTGKIDCV